MNLKKVKKTHKINQIFFSAFTMNIINFINNYNNWRICFHSSHKIHILKTMSIYLLITYFLVVFLQCLQSLMKLHRMLAIQKILSQSQGRPRISQYALTYIG